MRIAVGPRSLTRRARAVLCISVLVVVLGGSFGGGWTVHGRRPPERNAVATAYLLHPPGSGATVSVAGERAGLSATISARSPVQSGVPLALKVTYADQAAVGAVGPSSISFGDGSRLTFAQPQFCRLDPAPDRGSERLVHRYRQPGEYAIRLTVLANCVSGARVLLRLEVRIEP